MVYCDTTTQEAGDTMDPHTSKDPIADSAREPAPPLNPRWRTEPPPPERLRVRPRPVLPDPFFPVEHEFIPQPTAWHSILGAVRFAVWLWAITVIIGFVVGVVMLVFWLITAGALISQM